MQRPLQILTLASLLLAAQPALAQWTTQTIALRPGWNAVFLEIQPEPRDCDALFAGLQVESVWRYNRQVGKVQFITDPDKMVPNDPDWLTYLPSGNALAGASRLHVIEGGRAYLIKRASSADTLNWTVKGTPVLRQTEWLSDSLNLVGFQLAPGVAVTFQSFLSHSPALSSNYVYRLNTSGMWVRLNSPASTAMSPGEAFWVASSGVCDFGGTVQVETERRSGLVFGRELAEGTLKIRNTSTRAANITLRTVPSDVPAGSDTPALAGNVPLAYYVSDAANGRVGWTNLPGQLDSAIPAGGEYSLRLAVRRNAFIPSGRPPGSGEQYQTVLEVSDSTTRLRVPVTAEAVPRTGLWIGSAVFNKVSSPENPQILQPTASALQFRLIVHVDETGQTRLLQKVLQRWQNGTLKPAGNGSTNLVVDQPGRFVLLTDEVRAAQYQGAALRDGQEVGRRFSSAAFSMRVPVLMSRTAPFGTDDSTCSATVALNYNDPLNPFVHRYHPDHNNLDDRGRPLPTWDDGRGPQTSEAYTVTRNIELRFSSTDPNGLAVAAWQDKRLGGVYRETFAGLHKHPLIAEGTFQLFRVSDVGLLDQ